MKSPGNKKSNQVRIIAGEWRGRRLEFPHAQGLRPTPDRVRETLFNWLQAYLPGSRCLDLFAGTGVLGFEALSRGARSVSFVERDRDVYRALQQNQLKLAAAERASLLNMDAMEYLKTDCAEPFDIVFLDPPYGKGLVSECLSRLEGMHCLKAGGLLYMEHESGLGDADLSEKWLVLKHNKAGQVSYYLLRSVHTSTQENT